MGYDSQQEVRIPAGDGVLLGDLTLPASAQAVVTFVDGQGLGRHGVQDRTVARVLAAQGLGTLLVDLLTAREQEQPPRAGLHGPDLPRLTERVFTVAHWLDEHEATQSLALGLCGLGSGSAAALIAAARLGARARALVCMGGRPDEVGPSVLASVKAYTLLLAGSADLATLSACDAAYQHLRGERSLAVVPGGGPRLEHPAALQHAAEMAAAWYVAHTVPAEEMA